ncbi:hypothetical protein BGZ82_010523, partial [Podila clonocystis]
VRQYLPKFAATQPIDPGAKAIEGTGGSHPALASQPGQQLKSVLEVLAAAQTAPLNLIIFSGGSVNEWLQLWKSSKAHQPVNNNISTPPFPLVPVCSVGLIEPGAAFSHASVLLLHHALYTNPQLELKLENVQVGGRGDWEFPTQADQLFCGQE